MNFINKDKIIAIFTITAQYCPNGNIPRIIPSKTPMYFAVADPSADATNPFEIAETIDATPDMISLIPFASVTESTLPQAS